MGRHRKRGNRSPRHGRPTCQGRIPAVPIRKLHQALGFSNRCSDELHRVLSFTRWLDQCLTHDGWAPTTPRVRLRGRGSPVRTTSIPPKALTHQRMRKLRTSQVMEGRQGVQGKGELPSGRCRVSAEHTAQRVIPKGQAREPEAPREEHGHQPGKQRREKTRFQNFPSGQINN